MYGYVYLLQTRESERRNETIYKIGRTSQKELCRFNNYPKGSCLWLHMRCNDEIETEKRLINKFKKDFEQVELYGTEYFNGDVSKMIEIICNEIGYSCNAPVCIQKNLNEVNGLMNNISEYEEKNKELAQMNSNLVIEMENLISENNKLKRKLNGTDEEHSDNEENRRFKGTAIKQTENKKQCNICLKVFVRAVDCRNHENKCDGTHHLQCRICLKMFASPQSKYNHKLNVKCSPPAKYISSGQNGIDMSENIRKNTYKCSKCHKILHSKKRLRGHEEKCDGTHILQCKICLKMFASQQGKSKHKLNVKCSPPDIST